MGSWQDGNLFVQSTTASVTGSPSADDIIPQTQQSMDDSWEYSHNSNGSKSLTVIGCSGGFDPSIPDIFINSNQANSGEHPSDWMLVDHSAVPPLDAGLLTCR